MKTFLSSFAGTLLAILLIGVMAGGYAACVAGKKPKIEDHSYLIIEMHGGLLEYDPPGGIMSQIAGGDAETLQRILGNLEKAQVDDRIEGVILKVSWGSSMGGGKAQELRTAIKELQASGKKVYGFAESFEANHYYLLAACDEIFAPPSAFIGFRGFAFTSLHVKRSLEKLGIKPNIHKIKDYKSAAELVIREDMSEPARENLEWMVDDFWETFTQALAEDRNLSEEQITSLMEHAYFGAEEALEGGLIDRVIYWNEVEDMLTHEGDDELRTVSQARYAQVPPGKLGLKGKKTIAVIHAQGTIAGRKNTVDPLLGLMMGHESIVAELRRAREDDDVAAVVFRVDSRGGVALDSDLIAQEVEVTAAVKPVVASMVDVAASGGYLIAYRASKIVADPMTITGSIGSISGKFNLSGLYEKLGITHDHVTRGPMALMDSDLRDYTPEERARFEEDHWNGFNRWLRDVAEHRGMSFEEASKLAHGRVWTGQQANANGLIDEVGGLGYAIALAKQLAEIPVNDKVSVVHYPTKKTLIQSLMGGDRNLATAARWVVYRFIREDVARTWELVSHDPALLVNVPAP